MFVCVMVCLKLDVVLVLFLEWVCGICRGVGCREVFQVKAFFAKLRSPRWKAYRVPLIHQLLDFVFCGSQVGNNNFLQRCMISAWTNINQSIRKTLYIV